MNTAQVHQLEAQTRLLARITAIMQLDGGVRNMPATAIEWMATPEGGEAIRLWHTFQNAVDLYETTLEADRMHEQRIPR